MKNRIVLFCFTFALLGLPLITTACGGSGGQGGGTVTTPPAISVSASVTPATVQTGATAQATATVENDSSNKGVTWSLSGSGCTGAACGTLSATSSLSGTAIAYTAPATVPASTVTLQATSVADATKSATAAITVTVPTGSKPTISVSGDPSTATAGGTETVSFATTGNPTVTCNSQMFGAMAVSGTTASVAVPQSAASGTDTDTCTAVNTAGQAQGSTQITIQAATSAPTITSVSVEDPFCPPSGCLVTEVMVNGSGFAVGGVLSLAFPGSTSQKTQTLTLPSGTASNQIAINVDYIFDPGWMQYTYTSPTGVASNTLNTLFPGNLNTLVFTDTDADQLDQGGGAVQSFSLANNLAPDGTISNVDGSGIAYDPSTKALLVGEWENNIVLPNNLVGITTTSEPMGIAAGNGFACFSEFSGNTLGSFVIDTTVGSKLVANYTSLPGTPWNVAMTTLDGTPTCVAWSVETDTLSIASISSSGPTVIGSVNLPGLTAQSNLPFLAGGWDLAVAGTNAWLISDYDASATLVNLSTMSVVKQVPLSGIPLRAAINPVDGSVVVAMVSLANAQTTFVRSDTTANDLKPQALAATFTIPCTGLKISTDGSTIYCANRGQILSAKNQ